MKILLKGRTKANVKENSVLNKMFNNLWTNLKNQDINDFARFVLKIKSQKWSSVSNVILWCHVVCTKVQDE